MNRPSSSAAALTAALLARPEVADATVLWRDGGWSVYLVPAVTLPPATLAAKLEPVLRRHGEIGALSPVTRIPLNADGGIDRQALDRLPVWQAGDADRWQRLWTGRADVARVLVEEEADTEGGDDLARETVRPTARTGMPPAGPERRVGRPALIHGAEPPVRGDGVTTLMGMLQRAATRTPARGLIFVLADGREERLTYADLLRRAVAIQGGLRARGVRVGERLLLQLDDGPGFFAAFWGCIAGGFIPVPVTVPPDYARPGQVLEKLRQAWRRLGRSPLLTDAVHETALRELETALDMEGLTVWTVESLSMAPPAAPHAADGADTALMLLTSGSTGVPKVVPLTHDNLLAMSAGTIAMNGFTRDEVTLNWMPFDHVGVIAFLHLLPLDLIADQVQVDNGHVLRQPLHWLRLMDRHGATISWAPNFAYALIRERADALEKERFDLSRLHFLVNAGEANVAGTMVEFARLLAPFGLREGAMRPAFGMSETASGITWSPGFFPATDGGDRVVDLGGPIPGAALRVVDGAGALVDEGVIGRLQVRGPSVFAGYLDDEAENRRAFQDGWFATGDLGYLDRGRLRLTGRHKTDILIRGVNHHPHELESLVETIDGVTVGCTAACGVNEVDGDGETLAIFFHTPLTGEKSLGALARRIRGRLAEKTGMAPRHLLRLEREAIPRTTIGKIQHARLRHLFESGALPAQSLDGEERLPAWFFSQRWRHRRLPPREAWLGRVLLFEDPLGLVAALCQRSDAPARSTRVAWGSRFHRLADDRLQIDDERSADYRRLLTLLSETDRLPAEIVHARHYAPPSTPAEGVAELEERARQTVAGVLALVRAWGTVAGDRPLLLRVVVSHTLTDGEDRFPANEKGLLPPLLLTLEQERPGIRCQLIDLPVENLDRQAERLVAEIGTPPRERLVRYRQNRLVPVLRPMDFSDSFQPPWRTGGHYLITGGSGGIGQRLCRHLRERYGARLLIVGRRSIEETDFQPLDGIRHERADVGDYQAMETAVIRAEAARGAPLDAILHLAATVRERPLIEESAEELVTGQRAKIAGTWVVHRLAAQRPGCAVIHFSSVIGLFGGAGFGAHAAACGFQQAFSSRAEQPGRLLAWSQWRETGLSRGRGPAAARSRGFQTISPDRGLLSLEGVLGRAGEPMGLVGIDGAAPPMRALIEQPARPAWWLRAHVERRAVAGVAGPPPAIADPFGVPLPVRVSGVAAMPVLANGEIDRRRLPGADGRLPHRPPANEVEKTVAAIWSRLFGVDDPGVDDGFFEQGGSSLTAAGLVAGIRERLAVELPVSAVFSDPTIAGLARRIAAVKGEGGTSLPPIERLADGRSQPLSFAQERFWLLHRLAGDHPGLYNEVVVMRLRGGLDIPRLASSLGRVVARHPALRTGFRVVDGAVEQTVHSRVPVSLETVDPVADRETTVRERLEAHRARPFDLARPPLLRALLLRIDTTVWQLQLVIHHIIIDGRSLEKLLAEWSRSYRGETLDPAPILTTADFGHWQRSWMRGALEERQLDHWRQRLRGAPPLLDLPTDRPRPARPSHRADQVAVDLPPRLVERLRGLATATDATPFMTLLAIFAAVLHRFSGQEDLVIGCPVAERRPKGMEGVIGCFINTLALRCDLTGDPSFEALLRRVRAEAAAAYAHADIPFERLVENLAPERGAGLNPLFQVSLELAAGPPPALELPGVEVHPWRCPSSIIRVDLEMHLWPVAGWIRGYLLYARDLFDETGADRLRRAFMRLAVAVADDPARRPDHINLITGADRQRLRRWGAPGKPPPPGTIAQRFRAVATRTPEALAVGFGGEWLTYRQVDRWSNRLAHRLRALGVGPERPVASFLDRSPEMIVGLLAILKAGGIYMPLEPAHPEGRIRDLLTTCEPCLIMTNRTLAAELPDVGVPLLRLDADRDGIRHQPDRPLPDPGHPHGAAYLIFTSGSTGKPKGTVVGHGGFINMIQAQIDGFRITPADRVAQFSSCAFDVALFEVFLALFSGASLWPVPETVRSEPRAFEDFARRRKLTVLALTPPYLRLLDCGAMPDLRVLISGGEAADGDTLRGYARSRRCINAYGPTEASVCAAFHEVDADGDHALGVPIGSPLTNTELLILQGDVQAPIGAVGEICLAGIGLARGYWQRPDLTADRFVPHPFRAGERLYRTGDRGRWLVDGSVLFLGRVDDEVKVRGHRLTPGEIQRVMMTHPRVEAAHVLARAEAGGTELTGYFTADEGLQPARLRRFLAERLPRYMVPNRLLALPELPLLPNGKIDRAALPSAEPPVRTDALAPRTATETTVAEVWRRVLELETLGIRDNFFDVGGHSMRMIRVHDRLRDHFGPLLNVVEMFRYPTVETLAAEIDARRRVPSPVSSPSPDRRTRRRADLETRRQIRRSHRGEPQK